MCFSNCRLTFDLSNNCLEILDKHIICGDQQRQSELLLMGEGLWGVDTSLVQNAVDTVICDTKQIMTM